MLCCALSLIEASYGVSCEIGWQDEEACEREQHEQGQRSGARLQALKQGRRLIAQQQSSR